MVHGRDADVSNTAQRASADQARIALAALPALLDRQTVGVFDAGAAAAKDARGAGRVAGALGDEDGVLDGAAIADADVGDVVAHGEKNKKRDEKLKCVNSNADKKWKSRNREVEKRVVKKQVK